MQLNQATDYAFRAVLHLAKFASGEVVSAQTIASREEIPMRFLLKIMRSLIKAGIVKSYRGVDGGYTLAKSPREITLLDVVEAIEGSVHINRCLLDPEYCSKHWADCCPIHQVLDGIQANLVKELSRYNFAELAGKT
ncbi:MAG: RrF2 family transcriptional regulator [Bacillota bacterium]|uniref:Rrf2 family transcriptional regulator n=1 Tax=Thermanaerosceptrum fracticalcis TaxID=1712410 RepID=A0A7G6DZ69_THEFR|nr:Rrf2 family transcriptional regulator [Thermanaerosceptrum fracticalcis]QNB45123.1 Rrf2 family transcriptional regulator [Thermanaerosceptrum fracticalcis]